MDVAKTHCGAYGASVEYDTMVHKAPPTRLPAYTVPGATAHSLERHMQADVVNILILRRVKPELVPAFENAVREWIPTAIKHDGYLGVFMLKPGEESDEYGAILRFQSMGDWERFQSWSLYQQFADSIRPMLIDEPRVEPLHGLEAFFRGARRPPPRWKMALLTWLGVCGMVFVTSHGLGLVNSTWPWWTTFLLSNAIVVGGLTWIVMPLLTRVAAPWLAKEAKLKSDFLNQARSA